MLPIDLVQLTRAAEGLESTEEARDIVESRGDRDKVKDEIADELLQAVTTTLDARSINGVSHAQSRARTTRAKLL